jgi:hypothetical protein
MNGIQIFASPWWVNVAVLVPITCFVVWRKNGHPTPWRTLICAGLFAVAFGVDEAVVVIYLRAALAFPAFGMSLANAIPQNFAFIEVAREVATMVMLITVSLLASRNKREQVVTFLWMFAFWDIFYYVGLWFAIGWPASLLTQDVLFLIPQPWVAQVWFPVLVCVLSIAAILATKKSSKKNNSN